ncbi:MAG: AtpZ/AtpI family protein [Candidatus Rifleibacteriota bacterium]
MSDNQRNLIKKGGFAGKVLSTGLTGGICLVISLYFGHQIDLYFGTQPAGIFGGILLGLAAAIVQTWKQLKESLDEFDRDKRKDKEN